MSHSARDATQQLPAVFQMCFGSEVQGTARAAATTVYRDVLLTRAVQTAEKNKQHRGQVGPGPPSQPITAGTEQSLLHELPTAACPVRA